MATMHLHESTHKGPQIARHNKTVHQIVPTLQSNEHTRFYTLTTSRNKNSSLHDNTVP